MNGAAAFYREHGWYVSDHVLPLESIDRAREKLESLDADRRDGEIPAALSEFLAWPEGEPRSARLDQYAPFQHRALADLAFAPAIGEIAAQLTGSPQIRLFDSALIAERPDEDAPHAQVGWHTDLAHWPTCSSKEMLTAWIPLQDTSEATGTLTVVDGSHRWPSTAAVAELRRTRELVTDGPEDLEQRLRAVVEEVLPIPIELKKGQVSFHHCLALHGSGLNRGEGPRLALSVHLQDAGNRYRAATNGGGEPAEYIHDRFVRRLPSGEPDYADPEICPVLWPR